MSGKLARVVSVNTNIKNLKQILRNLMVRFGQAGVTNRLLINGPDYFPNLVVLIKGLICVIEN